MGRYGVQEVANLLNLSRTTIYKKFCNQLANYVKTDNKGKFIDNEGLEALKEILCVNDKCKPSANNELIDFYKSEIERLHNQIENKDTQFFEQLKNKDNQISELHRLLENSQILLKSEKEKIEVLEDKRYNKKSLFARIFKYKNKY